MEVVMVFFVSAFGSSLQELSYWYDARSKLTLKKYRAMLGSSAYWTITVLMIVGSGVATVIWSNFDASMYELRDYLVFGAAFPLIFKKAVGTASKISPQMKLGAEAQEQDRFSTKDTVKMW